MRDISETGARLKFQNPPTVSDTLELHIPVKGQTICAKLKWNKSDEIGIAFETTPALTSPQTTNHDLCDRIDRLEMEIASLKQLVKRLQNAGSSVQAA